MRSLLIACVAGSALYGAGAGKDPIPLFFVANQGQAPSPVRFMAQGSGLTAYFSPGEALFRMPDASVRVEFAGADPEARIEGFGELAARAHFLVGEEEKWRTGVALYRSVAYRGLYPGIDMVYGGNGRNLKSEFVVAPGADPARIRMRYSGAELRLNESGALIVTAGERELREEAPLIYQDAGGGRRVGVSGEFSLAGDGSVGFIVREYDRSLPLVIDPTLVYSTLLGGGNSDAALSMAVDSTGAAYVAGFTASYDLPTANPEQNFNAGGNDVFVAKLNAAGNGLVYCTYIGGRGDDRANGIAVDSTGAVYVTGSTTSSNFPMRYALQSRIAGAKNAFVLKLSPEGNSLAFSTYLGGNGSDAGNGIAIDSSKCAYVVGDTTSTTFPATAFQKGNHGSQDAFVAKFSADGIRLVYSTYLGGGSDDHGAAIALDASGDAYVTGSTWSTDFPVANAVQSGLGGGQDAFVAKLSPDGSSLLFSTFLGGSGGKVGYPEAGQGIAVGAQGSAYVTGVTSSTDFPLLNAVQIARVGWTDAFVTKLSPAGALVYSTYLGGSGVDAGNAIAVDSAGNAYIAGQTFSSDLPAINAIQSARGGDYDAFWAELGSGGGSILALSYLGGNGADTATAIALDGVGNVLLAGWTLSTNFPVLNGYQSTNAGNYGAFVAKVASGPMPAVAGVTPNSGSGTSQTFTFQFSDNAGVSDLTTVSALVNSSAGTTNACAVTYSPTANTLILLTDAGAAPAGTITPGSGSQQNSQCTLNGAGSSVLTVGNVLNLTLALSFQPAFSGAKIIYMQAANATVSTGWQQMGAWTVPATGPPAAVAVVPGSGAGRTQTFAFTYSDPRGYAAIISTQMLISTGAKSNACYLLYYRSTNAIYLTNDAGTAWQTPVTLGQTGALQNSQCSVDTAHSSASGSDNNLTVNLALNFQQSFSGDKYIYMEAHDDTYDSGWQQRGTWTVPASGTPSAVSVTPGSGSGSSQTFSFTFADPVGYTAIASTQMLISGSMVMSGACYLLYNRTLNAVYLANDAGTDWQSPATLGQSGTLQNSQCSVDAASSSASGSGTNLVVNLALTFKAAFSGSKNVYMEASDGTVDSGWQQLGTWSVPGSGPPAAVSVTPNSGSGSAQTFSFAFSDPAGYATIVSAQILINNPMAKSGACYLLYYRPNNAVYLTNDAGTAWQTPVTLGQSGALQNSQCSVDASSSSASGNGNTLTVSLALTFKPAFSGLRNIYMEVYDGVGDSGWQQRGSWTVP